LKVLNDHTTRLKTTFADKGFNEKKIQSLYPKFFNALDYRLLRLEGFHKQTLEAEDVSRFKASQKYSVPHSKIYRVFDKENLFNYLLNYGLAFSSIEQLLNSFFENPSGNNNLIFVPLNDECYSFYTLHKTDGTKRIWKMDCRLENLTLELAEVVKNYCITLFRELYKTCFDTNHYIVDYTKKFSVAEFECEQLLATIFVCVNFERFNQILRNIVQKKCTYNCTSNDKLDLKTEDKEQIENFKSYRLSNEDVRNLVLQIFDSIEDEYIGSMTSRY
jgi:hypothetical protein